MAEIATLQNERLVNLVRFACEHSRIGQRYLGRYAVWTTPGISGRRGIFVHDHDAQVVYTAILITRTSRHMRSLMKGGRVAALVVPGGHFTFTAFMEVIRRRYPFMADAIRPFSALSPLPELVRELNAFRPASLVGYPTLIRLLMQEHVAGRLTIEPELVTTEGEWLSPATRVQIEVTFHCTVRDNYGASEFLYVRNTRAAFNAEAGLRPGWDLAGTVEQQAAEAVAVPTTILAEIPESTPPQVDRKGQPYYIRFPLHGREAVMGAVLSTALPHYTDMYL